MAGDTRQLQLLLVQGERALPTQHLPPSSYWRVDTLDSLANDF